MNSYRDTSESIHYGCAGNEVYPTAAGFSTVYKAKVGGRRFVDLLDKVSGIDSEIRFRFTSPHPKVQYIKAQHSLFPLNADILFLFLSHGNGHIVTITMKFVNYYYSVLNVHLKFRIFLRRLSN